MKKIFAGVNTVIAASAGIIVLLGYFIDLPQISGFRFLLLQWAVILAGVALLVGVWNLFSVHLQKVREQKSGSVGSVVLLFFFLLTAIVGLTPDLQPFQNILLNGIMIPVESTLIAILSITLIFASIRMLQQRLNISSILFFSVAFILLLGTGPLPGMGQIPVISDMVRPFIGQVLAMGGSRGIMIGVALGTITTGVRILFGVDKPYGGNS